MNACRSCDSAGCVACPVQQRAAVQCEATPSKAQHSLEALEAEELSHESYGLLAVDTLQT